ncbi:MAG: type II toxin-antitoxin system VapC family toxin [Candidatus Bipolaricaulaceae bacterium]
MISRKSLVLDASVTLAWAFKEELNEYTRGVLWSLRKGQAIVPHLWALEVANALLVAERRGRLKRAEVEQFVGFLRELPIVVETEVPERILGEVLALAREQNLSVYDAAYLDLATRLGVPLATLDEPLKAAAGRVGVEVFQTK